MSALFLFSPITRFFPQNKPIFLGKAEPDAEITVCQSYSGSVLAKTTADQNGNWLVRSTVELPEGEYTFTAFHSGKYDYQPNITLHVERNAQPRAPILNPPLEKGSTPVITSPAFNRSTVQIPRLELAGKSAANAKIMAFLNNLTLAGEGTADDKGEWQLTLFQELALGENDVYIYHCNAANQPVSGPAVCTLTLAPSYPIVLPAGSAPILTSSTNVKSLRPWIEGKAAPNAIIHVFQEGGAVRFGQPVANAFGAFELQLTQSVNLDTNGAARFSMAQFDANGVMVSGWINFTLTCINNPVLPAGSAPILTSSTNVKSLRPWIEGKAAPNAIIHVFQEGGAVRFGQPVANAFGAFELQLTQSVNLDTNGAARFSMAQFDANGVMVSGWTNFTLTCINNPVLPAGSAPILTSSTNVKSLRPWIEGKAAPNAIIHVFQEGGAVRFGQPVANAFGAFELQLTQSVNLDTNGAARFSMAQFDANGAMVSGWTNFELTVKAS